MTNRARQQWVLAVDPVVRGFAFAIMEGPKTLVRVGIKHIDQDKHRRCLKRITELMEQYPLDAIIVENYKGMGSRRSLRVQRLIKSVRDLAARQQLRIYAFSREDIWKFFSRFNAVTRYEIATAIADRLPQLKLHLPPRPKFWETESNNMNIFDAVALALTFFHSQNKRRRAA